MGLFDFLKGKNAKAEAEEPVSTNSIYDIQAVGNSYQRGNDAQEELFELFMDTTSEQRQQIVDTIDTMLEYASRSQKIKFAQDCQSYCERRLPPNEWVFSRFEELMH